MGPDGGYTEQNAVPQEQIDKASPGEVKSGAAADARTECTGATVWRADGYHCATPPGDPQPPVGFTKHVAVAERAGPFVMPVLVCPDMETLGYVRQLIAEELIQRRGNRVFGDRVVRDPGLVPVEDYDCAVLDDGQEIWSDVNPHWFPEVWVYFPDKKWGVDGITYPHMVR